MYAVSIRQPFATLIAEGCKNFELRSAKLGWRYVDTRIGIHAASAYTRMVIVNHVLYGIEKGHHLKLGFRDSDAALTKAVKIMESYVVDRSSFVRNTMVCSVVFQDAMNCLQLAEHLNVDVESFSPSSWAWPIKSRSKKKITPPYQCAGRTSFWAFDERLLEKQKISGQNERRKDPLNRNASSAA